MSPAIALFADLGRTLHVTSNRAQKLAILLLLSGYKFSPKRSIFFNLDSARLKRLLHITT